MLVLLPVSIRPGNPLSLIHHPGTGSAVTVCMSTFMEA